VDTLEHAIFTTPDRGDYFDAELAEEMARSGTFVSPTLTPMLGTIRKLQAQQTEGTLTPEDAATLESMQRRTEVKVKNCRRLVEMGVPVASSTDAGWRINHFGDYADCLELLAGAGVPSSEVFRSATQVPARALNQGDVLGHLRPGAWGDAMVLRGDPVEDIRAVREVVEVYVGGQRVQG
jgi:imidazolonepropionase-like amidohydrolase